MLLRIGQDMKLFKNLFIVVFFTFLLGGIYINYIMEKSVNIKQNIVVNKEFAIVLGASVHGNELSEALRGRMNVAIELYKKRFC